MSAVKSREIRVFLSSTFRDMDAERSHLVKQVFPKVRAACHARQVGFTEIDLRWGVTEEESKNGATVEICLKEIDRCRDFPPFFIGFLGERYGWIPKHEDLATYWQKHKDSVYAQPIQQAVMRGISVTELEMELGVLGTDDHPAAMQLPSLTDHALFCLRSPAFSQALYDQAQGSSSPAREADFIDPACGRLDALKVRIRASGLLGLDHYTSIEAFGEKIEAHLLSALDRYFPASEIPSAAQRREAAHAAFRHHRLQNFLPRPDVLETLLARMAERLERPSLGPILLDGSSGQGKSALMADLARHLETAGIIRTPQGDVRYRVIDHYIGADDASSLDAWILRLLDVLHPEIEHLTGPIPEATKGRREALSTWLAYAARQSERQALEQEGVAVRIRFALLLDAVDQLGDRGADLDLLKPEILGPDAILVASAADGTPAAQRECFQTTVHVPPLDDALRNTLISATLQRFRKTLPEADARRLAQTPQAGSPLFLGLALEELRVDAHHETLGDLVTDILRAPDAAQLFLNNFLLDPDYARPTKADLAVHFMAFLGASRVGLTENELADLLALPTDPVAEDTQAPRLPQKHLSNLLANFGPFLLNKEGRRAPMHRIFGEAALAHLGEVCIREHIYTHLSPRYGFGEIKFDRRGAAEALHQVTKLAQREHSRQGKWRERLEMDLGHFSLPTRLHDAEENVVYEALKCLTYQEKSELAERWRLQVEPLAEEDIGGLGEQICSLGWWLYKRVGHLLSAKAVQTPLLVVQRRILGEEHLDTLETMQNLACTLQAQGDLPGALTLSESVLNASIRTRGEKHPGTYAVMGNIADILREQGDLPAARRMNESVVETFRRTLGKEHSHTLRAMGNLACTMSDQNDLQGAKVLEESVLEGFRHTLGVEHPDTLKATINYAVTLSELNNLVEARSLLELSVKDCRRLLGEEHRDTLWAIDSLADTLCRQGEKSGARSLQESLLEARQRILGDEHSDTLNAMIKLCNTLDAQGDLPRVRVLQESLLESRRRDPGEGHPDTLRIMSNLAVTLFDLGDLQGARVHQMSALEAFRRIQGDEDPETLMAMGNLANTLESLGEIGHASDLRAEALAIRHKSSSIAAGGTSMRLTETLKQWLTEQEWNEEPEIDEEKQTSSTGFSYTVDDFTFKCWFDIDEGDAVFKLFMYFLDTKTPVKKLDEVQKFVTAASNRLTIGTLQLLRDDRSIRYYAAIDIETATIDSARISNLLNAGVGAMTNWLPGYLAICYGGKTAEDVIAEN